MKTPITLYFIMLIFIATLTACESEVCLACTEELRTEFVVVQDQAQNPLTLDEFSVFNTRMNQKVGPDWTAEEVETFRETGRYPLIDDAHILASKTLQIQFRGFLHGAQIITENYVVASDCCSHITSVEGNQDLTVGTD